MFDLGAVALLNLMGEADQLWIHQSQGTHDALSALSMCISAAS